MPVFWHISPTEISASACFGLSLFIFISGKSLPVLFYFILSASAWVILLKSSSCFKSSSVMLLDTPLKTKILSFLASAEWYDFGTDILTFFPKTCCIFGSLCRMAKSLGVSPTKIQPFFVCLICKTLRFGWYCLHSSPPLRRGGSFEDRTHEISGIQDLRSMKLTSAFLC